MEKSVVPESIDRDRWEWMQNYRVWEANRKVFLYPENWLFPEVRDDRTETFRAFESALTQSEPSHDNAVKALRQYLDDLVEVSQISVMGMYEHAEETDERDAWGKKKIRYTLYLVGRSPNPPYAFYWRQALYYGQPGIHWTGWERIDQDLSGDHIIPFVFEGEFHIAWPLIKRGQTDDKKDYFELQLAWTRYTSSGWTKRKLSREASLRFLAIPSRDERSMFAFRVFEQSGRIAIRCYVAKDSSTMVPRMPPERAGELRSTLSQLHSAYPGNKEVSLNAAGFAHYTNPERYDPVLLYITIYIRDMSTVGFHGVGLNGFNIPNSIQNVWVHIQPWIPVPGDVGQIYPYDPTVLSNDSRVDMSINVVFERGQNINPTDVDHNLAMPLDATGEWSFQEGKDVEWMPSSGRLIPSTGVLIWSSGLMEQNVNSITGLPGVFANSKTTGRFFAKEADPDNQATISATHTTWYVLEGDTQFLVKRDNTQYLVSEIFPCGFTDGLAYKVQFLKNPKTLYDPLSQDRRLPANNLGRNTWFGVGDLDTYYPTIIGPSDPRQLPLLAFNLVMPNALYNWEVFYHLPIAAATFLSRQHRFEDARRWFHFIFDPTTDDSSTGRERFWRFLPFRNAQVPDTITQLLEALAGAPTGNQQSLAVQAQVAAWLEDPFNPFAVARLRPSAFEWYTVVSYINNLIAWADQLFRRDTRESINEATLLYIMAAQILGPRPEKIRVRNGYQKSLSYRALNALKGDLDDSSNVWLTLTDTSIAKAWKKSTNSQTMVSEFGPLSSIGSLYFCVPPNEKLPELWDTVDDRLFKIRHCQNIEGITRSLPLYEPPIDPELLIRAKAAGLDLADVLADRFAPLPHYRFQILLQKANEFCNEVKSLGSAILSAVEKKEAEHLALLRSSQEIAMLKLIELVKEEQIKEAEANIEALNKTRNNALDRFVFLQHQLGKNQITFDAAGSPIVEQSLMTQVQETGSPDDVRSLSLINTEVEQLWKMQAAHDFAIVSAVTKAASGIAHTAGAAFDPSGTAHRVASSIGHGLSVVADGFGMVSTIHGYLERRAGLIGSWQRRRDDWVQQSRMTAEEIRQIDKQIVALEIRKVIAEMELENHRKQIEHASNIDDYMRHLKFSGESLYGWMESQIAGLYFSAYQMAYDLAKKAERAYQFELGEPSSSFVQFGHWDSMRKGLLSGERLSQNLRRMEAAHLERNRREYEITKHISLQQLNADALLQLKTTGSCEFNIPEWIFDLDCPGHYMRRIKTVSVSIPCVAGPYTSINCTLSLQKSTIRKSALLKGNEYRRDGSEDDRFIDYYGTIQSIVTSNAQNDSGLFETNLRDERYLPFEGAGAESTWMLELPSDFKQFDYNTISDVIIHIRYTAREGGGLKAKAVLQIKDIVKNINDSGLTRLFSLRHDFPTEWHRFVSSNEDFKAIIKKDYFPYLAQAKDLEINVDKIRLFSITDEGLKFKDITIPVDFNNNIKAKNKDNQSELPIPKADVDKNAEILLILSYSLGK